MASRKKAQPALLPAGGQVGGGRSGQNRRTGSAKPCTVVQDAGSGPGVGLSYQYQFGLIPKYHSVAGYLGA